MSNPVSKPVRKEAGAAKRAPARSASRKSVPRKAAASPAAPSESMLKAPKNLLTAGIKALSNAHEEAVARQSRVFESLLGLGPNREVGRDAKRDAPEPSPALDPFGFKKFEDVFDQRVAKAMQHLGVPTVEAFAELVAEVERLREAIGRLEAQARKR